MASKAILPELTERYARLGVMSERGWVRLPSWARFYLELGNALAAFHGENTRYVAALSVPTRSYAIPFLCAGLSCANVYLHPNINQQHIDIIFSLPPGTSVKYLDKERVKKAIIQDIKIIDGQQRIGLLIEEDGNKTVYISSSTAYKIDISDRDYTHLPKHQSGRAIQKPSGMLSELLKEKTEEYRFQTRIDGVVIGSGSELKQESELPLAIQISAKGWQPGNLVDIFRCIGFGTSNAGYRYLIQSATRNDPAVSQDGLADHAVTIFDGSLAFSKWNRFFSRQNWIVMLNRTDAGFKNACAQVNTTFYDRSEKKIKLLAPPIPSGIEVMIFVRDI